MKHLELALNFFQALLPATNGVTTRQILVALNSKSKMDRINRIVNALLKDEPVVLNNSLICSRSPVSFVQLRLPLDPAMEIKAMWAQCQFNATEPDPFDLSVFSPVTIEQRMVALPFAADKAVTPYDALKQMSLVPVAPCTAFWALSYVSDQVRRRKHGDYIVPGATRVVDGEKQMLRLRILPHVRTAGWAPIDNMAYPPGTIFLGEEVVVR